MFGEEINWETVAEMGGVWRMEKRNTHRVLVGKFEGKEHMEDIKKNMTMILKSFFKK
jgi:hypothetical protein